MALKKAEADGIRIDPLKRGYATVRIIGETPLYFNAMSVKAKRNLLVGGGKKTAAEKKDIKHAPEAEFRDSVYVMDDGDTYLGFPAPAVKAAMSTAALETAGVTKSSVQRLIFLPQHRIRIWGKPYLKMDVVRSADANRTPDVRTRAFLPRWCAEVEIAYVMPTLSLQSIVTLLANAGVIVGIGDFRQEKGKGNFGTFSIETDGDDRWAEISREGRDVQRRMMEHPVFADPETEALMAMLVGERQRRAA